MIFRLPVNTPAVNWRDGQKVLQEDLVDDQSHFSQADAAIVNNHLGSGLLLENPTINKIFDSDELTSTQAQYVATNDFDGRGITPHAQPTDSILGNQFVLTLTDADVALRRSVKICIIGTDFQNALQYEVFYFYANEIQVGKKHFKTVITLLFNDFLGNKNGSRSLGGRLIIEEASPMHLSRDEITASQNFEPNLFFRDFKVVDQTIGPNPSMLLYNTLVAALGTSGYTVDALNINVGYVDKKSLVPNDISTRYGQKFLAKVNNIQKIRILLGIERDTITSPGDATKWFDWSGDLIISVHAIQTSVACPTDTLPDNAIDYQPNPSPIVQVILTQAALRNDGIVLTDIAQPVDVMFTNTRIGSYTNTGITAGNYYVVTVQRAGDTTLGNLFTLTGRDYVSNSVFTEFNGTTWVDDPTLDLWFEVYSDSLKVSDGQGYDAGAGISIDKTIIDSDSGATIDHSEDGIAFINSGNKVTNIAIVQGVNELTDQIQDSRTGNPVFPRKQNAAEISTITVSQLSTIEQSSDPIVLGCATDISNKTTLSITGSQNYIGMANGNTFCIVDPTEINTLLLYNLVGSKFNPNTGNPNAAQYLIYKAVLCTDGYADLLRDGYVGSDDIDKITTMLGEDITTAATQQKIVDGYFTILQFLQADINGDGVISVADLALATALFNHDTSVVLPYGNSFRRLCLYVENLYGRNDGYHSSFDGYARMWDTVIPRQAQYGIDPLLPLGSYINTYYGYPVPVSVGVNEPALNLVPFAPVPYMISLKPTWMKEFVKVKYDARLLPCAFTSMTSTTVNECVDPVRSYCNIIDYAPVCSGGRSDFYLPDNLIIDKGQILNRDGSNYKVDMEVATITLNLPDLPIYDKSLDIFHLFVCEEAISHNGFTSAGYPGMKFADCSFVQANALALEQVRFSVALESMSISTDGYDISIFDGYGIICDPLIGTYIDNTTGVLTIRATNVNSDPMITMNCRILVTVYLKKSGFVNKHTEVLENELTFLLGL